MKKKKKKDPNRAEKSILEEINRILDGTEGQFRVKTGKGKSLELNKKKKHKKT